MLNTRSTVRSDALCLDLFSGLQITGCGRVVLVAQPDALHPRRAFRAEVWSAGMVVFELANGQCPRVSGHFMNVQLQ